MSPGEDSIPATAASDTPNTEGSNVGFNGGRLRLQRRSSSQNTYGLDTDSFSRSSIISKNAGRRLSTFASQQTAQKFTEQQKTTLSKFSSLSYSPTHSQLYQNWSRELDQKDLGPCSYADRWLLLSLIGISIGLVAALLKQCIQALSKVRWDRTREYIESGDLGHAWAWNSGIGVVFVLISSFCVCFIHPPAAGGGTPEVISFLNGIVVHGSLSLKNLIVKFIANVFAVSSGLPAAIQGPIINYGAIIGAGVGQFESKSLSWSAPVFKRFRNAVDRRSFTTAGVAAGVAAAFNAPFGGLLFAMEDLSSFWSKHLSWQTFYCCVVATAVANLFNTAFTGFQFSKVFGLFSLSVSEPIQIHVACLVPAILLGLIGGLLGALFTQLNQCIVLGRKKVLGCIHSPLAQKVARMAETVLLVCLMHTCMTIMPKAFQCFEQHGKNMTSADQECYYKGNNRYVIQLERYDCPLPNATEAATYYYNDAATLTMSSGQAYLDKLWSRSTHYTFHYPALLSVTAVWFVMTAWTAGSAIAGGIFVPTLVTGSLYGRAVGLATLAVWARVSGTPVPEEAEWDWIDPGVMSVIGAASLLSGVTRLAIAATAIVVEMSHDIDLVVPVLIAILVAKFVADFLSKPLFKIQLDSKSLPYLDQDPQVVVDGALVNLELYQVSDIMKHPVCTIHSTETVAALARLLVDTDHGAFPVVRYDEDTRSELALGLVTRNELYVILCSTDVYDVDKQGSIICPVIPYKDISVDYIADPSAALERVKTYAKFSLYNNIFVSLDTFISQSVPKIDQDFSLHRAYTFFRTLGLRHLVVTDIRNRVVGIVTRKDLMAFNISEKLGKLEEESSEDPYDEANENGYTILPSVTVSMVGGEITSLPIKEEEEETEAEEPAYTALTTGAMPAGRPTLSRRHSVTIVLPDKSGSRGLGIPESASVSSYPRTPDEPSIVQQLSVHPLSLAGSRHNSNRLLSQISIDTPL